MNIPLYYFKILFSSALVMLCSMSSFGQVATVEIIEVEIVKNEFFSSPFQNDYEYASIKQHPQNGTAELDYPPSGYEGEYLIEYSPNHDFVGNDVIIVEHFIDVNYFPGWKRIHKVYQITVNPSFIKAVDDFASTTSGSSVVVNVLENDDWIGSDVPHIESVTFVNSGLGICTPGSSCGSITFTPNDGFSGIAHLNYTICDDAGDCDDAIVNISVELPNQPQYDTLSIITSREVEKVVLFDLQGYTLDSNNGPEAGVLIQPEDLPVPVYLPNPSYIGYDDFTFVKQNNGMLFYRHVNVHIIDATVPNQYFKDDNAYTSRGQQIRIDVGKNDIVSPQFQYLVVSQAQNGTATVINQDGSYYIDYVPNSPEFSGIDVFTYRGYLSAFQYEEAQVYVHVHDHQPEAAVYHLNATKGIPLVLEYPVPLQSYSFNLTGNAIDGQTPLGNNVQIFDGYQSINVLGQVSEGRNQIMFEPGSSFVGIDEFELEYCTPNNDCYVVKLIIDVLDVEVSEEIACAGSNCVWVGDTNKDGQVNMKDLLPIGLCMGEEGTQRLTHDLGNDWYGMYSSDWNDPLEQPGFDLKHIDTNGDSIISVLDTTAILDHYGKIHNIIPVPAPSSDLPIYFEAETDQPYELGDHVTLDILLGKPVEHAKMAYDIHGIVASFNYEPSFIQEGSLNITFPSDTWMSYDAPSLGLFKNHHNEGKVDIGYTRTNGVSVDGYGLIAKLDFVIVEDLVDTRLNVTAGGTITLPFSLNNTSVMHSSGSNTGISGSDFELVINIDEDQNNVFNNTATLKVFPNPAKNFINLYVNGSDHTIDNYRIYDVTGKTLNAGTVQDKGTTIDVNKLPQGLYLIDVITNNGETLRQKFEVVQ